MCKHILGSLLGPVKRNVGKIHVFRVKAAVSLAMRLRHRIGLLLSGALVSWYAYTYVGRGVLAYENLRAVQVFPAGMVAIGIFIALLSLLPPYRSKKR